MSRRICSRSRPSSSLLGSASSGQRPASKRCGTPSRLESCVVLLDVQMPEMDGTRDGGATRKRPRTRDVPVIFLTAISKDDSFVARGYEAGAVDYLFKPYDPDALRTKVATFVELGEKNARMRAQNEALRVGSQRSSLTSSGGASGATKTWPTRCRRSYGRPTQRERHHVPQSAVVDARRRGGGK